MTREGLHVVRAGLGVPVLRGRLFIWSLNGYRLGHVNVGKGVPIILTGGDARLVAVLTMCFSALLGCAGLDYLVRGFLGRDDPNEKDSDWN